MVTNIKLIGPEIKARPGEIVTLQAEFANPCWSYIHERRSEHGYFFINEQQGSNKHVYDATIHEDTTHFIFSIGDEGKPDLAMTNNIGQLWCPVTLTSDEQQDTSEDLGKYLYKVGLLSDYHICVDNDNNTSSKTDDWWDEDDFKTAMNKFVADPDVKFIAGCGDVLESGSPKLATPEDDRNEFYNMYDVPYWQVAGLRFFTPLGNHDFYGIFESRNGDTILPERFTNANSISGHNTGVNDRIGKISIGDQGINGIVPGRGRIVFDAPDNKVHTNGQGDMRFFAYNAYIEMYKDAAKYKKDLTPSENRFSDEATSTMKKYVLDNWNNCKDDISGWNKDRKGMRNAYSKLNYWLQKDNDIYIFLSVDYGDDVWSINNEWHDRMIHARTIINLNTDDPYIKRMKEYVSDTEYSSADEPYNYQYYSPNTLIWLKEIIENNKNKKIYVFTHHFLPHKSGNSNGVPQNGAYQYSDINKAGDLIATGLNKGSNSVTGIEFWFLNKLQNLYKNVIWFSGHSHISWEVDGHFDNNDYTIVSPSAQNKYVYTKATSIPKSKSAWTVSLPSLSKPRFINNNESQRLYEDAEMGIMEVYEKGVKIKGYKIRENNKDSNVLLAEKSIKLI